MNKKDLVPLSIQVPPLSVQHGFGERQAASTRLRSAADQHRADIDALFASLQHRAFNGEL